MGCIGSKEEQPKGAKKKSTSEIVSDTRGSSSSALMVTKQTEISEKRQVISTRTSTNSSISQTITTNSSRAASTKVPAVGYTPVYKRPSLPGSTDATPFNYLRPPANISAGPALPASRNTVKPVQSANTYDLSKNAYVLVFHHYSFKDKRNNREGSTRDMQKIRQVFNHYRCDALDVNENKTVAQVEKKMMEIKDKDFTKHSCLIVFIMSHGSVNDDILAHDGKWYNFQKDVVEFCTANRTLKEKPKMFVLQACRGDARIVADATPSMSHKIDLIIFQSSYQGSGAVSYRHKEMGSFFMQSFLRLLQEHDGENILTINQLLNQEFKQNNILQTPTLVTTLEKTLIFGHLRR